MTKYLMIINHGIVFNPNIATVDQILFHIATPEALLVSKSGRIYLVRVNHIRSILPTSLSLAILCGQNRPDMIDSEHITKCSYTQPDMIVKVTGQKYPFMVNLRCVF